MNAQALRPVVRELLPDKFLNALRVDDRSNQIVYTPASLRLLMLFGVGCCKSQAQRSRCHERGLAPAWRVQVMHLVKNNKFEGIAILRHHLATQALASNAALQAL